MAIDIREGFHRIGKATNLIFSAAVGVSLFFSQDNLTQYLLVRAPLIPPKEIAECRSSDYRKWIGSSSATIGYNRVLCFEQYPSDDGKMRGIPFAYSEDKKSWHVNTPYSQEVTEYMDKYASSLEVDQYPPPPIKTRIFDLLTRVTKAFGGAALSFCILFMIFRGIAWIANGFIKR
ncbi:MULTISPECIES: hypothetical protein [unclassified Herbaspirillum]|uniref:hypothetical protein n=1 Tax=unclassified Herbaspirillum TaxID=2624150 RepID=UPI002579CF41|nr:MULTISPECIES: hypothetical protein [unclassified Herbaspirillum]|tara:strand:+ start:798 stop:1325 length:528 start_codon:yes stop_codon:yes gene_type:complete